MIFKHELRSNRKSLLIWIACIAGFDFCMILMFPKLQESMAMMAESVESMGVFGEAFGMDSLSLGEPLGYYGTYIGAMLSLCGAIFAAILGCGMISKEESGHTAEYLFTLPYTKVHIVLRKVFAVCFMVIIFDIVNFIAGIAGLTIVDADYSLKAIILYHVAQTFLHLEIAAIALLFSACTKRTNLAFGIGCSLILYFMDMMGRIIGQLKFFTYISPFYYANAANVLQKKEIDVPLLLIGVIITIACIISATIVFDRRDLAS